MSFIFPLIYIIFFTYSLSLLFKKIKFIILLPFTFIISSLILFLSGMIFKTFLIGKLINIILALVFPIYLIINKYSLKTIKEKYLTNEVLIFFLVYVMIYIYDFNRFFTRWDELSHWGMMVKEMFRLDNFYSISSSHLLVHTDYPPSFSLLEYFYAFLCGSFKESYLIRSLHLFSATLILSVLNINITKKDLIFKTIYIIIFTYFLTFLFDTIIIINTIYIDFVLSLLVAVIMYHVLNIKEYNLSSNILLSLALIFLLLAKQVSIAFYLMIVFLVFINLVMKKIKLSKKELIITLTLFLLPILFFLIWNSYIKSLGIVGQFNLSDIKLNTFIDILKGKVKVWQLETIKNFLLALFNKPLLNSNVNLSYIQFFFIISLLIFLLYHNLKIENKLKKMISLGSTLFIGYIGYMVLMLVLYVYSFGPIEGPNLASFERYMNSYILICIYVIMFIYLKHNEITINNSKKYIIVLFLLLLIIKPLSYAKLRPDLIVLNNNFYKPYKNASKLIDKYVKLNDKVYIIDQVEKDGAVFYINYFSNKITTNLINYNLVTNIPNIEQNFKLNYLPYLSNYDYLYTYSLNEELINQYKFLSISPLKEKTLYKINKNNFYYLEEIDSE